MELDVAPAAPQPGMPKVWLADTGSPFDIVGRDAVGEGYLQRNAVKVKESTRLNTAGGIVDT